VEDGAVGAGEQAGLPLGVEEAEAAEAGVGEARGEDALAAAGRAAHGDDEAAGLRAAAEGVERRAHGCGGRFARKDAAAYAAPAASRVSHVGLKVTGLKVTGLKVTGLKVEGTSPSLPVGPSPFALRPSPFALRPSPLPRHPPTPGAPSRTPARMGEVAGHRRAAEADQDVSRQRPRRDSGEPA